MSKKHTFKTWKSIKYVNGKLTKPTGEETFYFETNDKDVPIKLGDGSFGVVYSVKSLNSEDRYAIKLFYTREDVIHLSDKEQNDNTKERFLLELKYLDNIKKRWAIFSQSNKNDTPDKFTPIGVIKPHSGTAEFLKSIAYNNLFTKGNLQNIKVADYAIIMPRYGGTLKDLLETKKDNDGLTGYDALRKAEFNLRTIAMLPILKTIILGLKTLYIGDYRHLDIKPANIFYRGGGFSDLEFVLADMGYLNTKGKAAPANQTLIEEEKELNQLLGTRHYRSPEQIDYFDRCDAKVEVKGKEVILKINDPKFHDSIMDRNDVLFFSKSKDRYTYEIEKYIPPSNGNDYVTLKITANHEEKEKILAEEKTQIEFRKKQSIKTDLFGVAAIAYDFLTAGKSPERFYERIRNLDFDKGNISTIMQRYRGLKAYKTNDQEIQQIFKPLKHDNKYPDPEIIEFILKCMLYNVKETYADSHQNSKAQHELFDKIYSDLNQIKNSVSKKIKKESALNVTLELLVKKNVNIVDGKNLQMVNNLQMSDAIDTLMSIDDDKFYWRLASGIKHLGMLIKFVQNEIFQPGESKTQFFAEIYPENLSIIKNDKETKLEANDIAYREERDYIDDIRKDLVLTKIYTDFTDFFVPEDIPFIRKPMNIKLVKGQEGNQLLCKYDFKSRSFLGARLKKGDWVIYQKDDNPKYLYKVISINQIEKEMILEKYKDNNSTKNNSDSGLAEELSKLEENISLEVVYYHNIDRLKYYLQLLGVYIQHLFFAGQGKMNLKTTPKIIKLIQNNIKKNYWDFQPKKNPIINIYSHLANLYAKLILVDDKNSIYHRFQHEEKKEDIEHRTFIELTTELESIQHLIEQTLFNQKGFIKATPFHLLDTYEHCESNLNGEKVNQHNFNEIHLDSILNDILISNDNPFRKGKNIFNQVTRRVFKIGS